MKKNKVFNNALSFLIVAALCVATVFLNIHFNKLQKEKRQEVLKLEEQKKNQLRENSRLGERNNYTSQEVEILRSDSSTEAIEEILRADYGMVRENETVFILKSLKAIENMPDIAGIEAFEMAQESTALPPEIEINPDKTLPKAEDR